MFVLSREVAHQDQVIRVTQDYIPACQRVLPAAAADLLQKPRPGVSKSLAAASTGPLTPGDRERARADDPNSEQPECPSVL